MKQSDPSHSQIVIPESNSLKAAPKVICLCGSTRFIEAFAIKTWELEREGNIVLGCTLLPMWYCNVPSHFGEATGTKEQCDELHKRKIDLADEVLILDVDGYIGESTRSEIEYATALGKPIRYLSHEQLSTSDVFRDPNLGTSVRPETERSESSSSSVVWDEAIRAARVRKDAFVDNPGDGDVAGASNVLYGMLEIIDALESAKQSQSQPTDAEMVDRDSDCPDPCIRNGCAHSKDDHVFRYCTVADCDCRKFVGKDA
jgi:hypothetical protein